MTQPRISIPFSGIHETGENVPCLKHFFRCLETSGSLWYDSKGGVIINPVQTASPGSLVIDTVNQTVDPYMNPYDSELHAGVWATVPRGYSVLVLAVAKVHNNLDSEPATFRTFRSNLGVGATGRGISPAISSTMSTGTHAQVIGYKVSDGTSATDRISWQGGFPAVASTTVIDGGAIDNRIVAMNYRWASPEAVTPYGYNKCEIRNQDGTLYSSLDANTGVGYSTTIMTDIVPAARTSVAGGAFFGWAAFYFNGVFPADTDQACQWMAAEWIAGRRYIWPRWIGVS